MVVSQLMFNSIASLFNELSAGRNVSLHSDTLSWLEPSEAINVLCLAETSLGQLTMSIVYGLTWPEIRVIELLPSVQFFSNIMTRISYILIRWWWCPLCTRPTSLVRFSIVLSHWNNRPHVVPPKHIILIMCQSLFFLRRAAVKKQ